MPFPIRQAGYVFLRVRIMNTMISRRRFLQASSAGLAGAGLAGWAAGSVQAAGRAAPSDRVRIGLIGCRNRGFHVARNHVRLPDVEVAVLCDIDQGVVERQAAAFAEAGGAPRLETDFRRVLDDPAIDAVIIGTPDHWHALMTVLACRAGKDVYVEKPMALRLDELDVMLRAAKRYDRVVQVGQQQRSAPHFQDAVRYVRSGALGRIRHIRVWSESGSLLLPQPDGPAPPGVDYDLWLGPAPQRPFNPNRFHGMWRYFWDYGGGVMTVWGVHMLDVGLWAMDVESPRSVVSMGGKFVSPDSANETPDTQTALYDFGDFMMTWEHASRQTNMPYGMSHGAAFYGMNGMLVVNRNQWEVVPEVQDGRPLMEALPPVRGKGDGTNYHVENFISCIKSREEPACSLEAGRRAALAAMLGNVAYRTGRRIHWDAPQHRIQEGADANELARYDYRRPWTMPQV